jgi:RNA 3'-terminal phosphate cyclase (ATP)
MLFMTVLPILIFARKPSLISISGGLFQDFAPSAFHMKHVLFPLLKRMGINAEMDIIRPGYVPTGGGIIKGRIEPITQSIQPLQLLNQGRITEIRGIALSSHLKAQKVSERMANSCNRTLKKDSLCAEFEIINDEMALQKGATLFIETRTDTECILGADMAGKIGRTSEVIGQEVAYHLLSDLRSGATVDRYLADQLIVYAALAAGITEYLIPTPTEHVKTNLWLIEEILGTETSLIKNHVTIKGVGIDPKKHR